MDPKEVATSLVMPSSIVGVGVSPGPPVVRFSTGAGQGLAVHRPFSPPAGLVPTTGGRARLAREAGQPLISHESIYRFIYAQLARKKDYSWRHYLPRAKAKRGWRGRKGGSPASFITLRRPLAQRSPEAQDRRCPGHWEADLMLFRTYGQAVLTLHERHSRLLLALRPPSPGATLSRGPGPSMSRPLGGRSHALPHLRSSCPHSP